MTVRFVGFGLSYLDWRTLFPILFRNQRILIHKTFEVLTERGKSSIGCFFGFKLHLIINDKDEILDSYLRQETWMIGNR